MARLSHIPLKKEWLMVLGVAVIVVGAVGTAGYFYYQNEMAQQELRNNPKSPQAVAQEVNSVVAKVNKIMLLPENEQPTLATVSDITKLINQPFFARAKNGDKVLIYQKSKKAVLYRPSENKIIEVSSVSIGENTEVGGVTTQKTANPSASITTAPTPTDPIRLSIYNGTTISGLTREVEKVLSNAFPNQTSVSRGNANTQHYSNTIVVVLNPAYTVAAQDIASVVKGKIAPLPSGEEKPEADILIIVGQSFGESQ